MLAIISDCSGSVSVLASTRFSEIIDNTTVVDSGLARMAWPFPIHVEVESLQPSQNRSNHVENSDIIKINTFATVLTNVLNLG